jgi:GT2 family glycosyltransferase
MLSVIVVNHNGQKYLNKCLSSLADQCADDFEVIIVDNGSTDGSEKNIKSWLPDSKLIKLHINKGYSGALNEGIRYAKGDYILALNNDTVLDRHFIASIRLPMEADVSVGMCASKMLLPDGRINSTGICLSRSGAAWDRGMFQPDEGQFDQPGEVFGPCGGAALYRREMLDEIGYFDEDFFLYMEDVDVAFRGRLAGWQCVYVPQAVVLHHHSGTSGYGSDLSVYYGNRNIIWYTIKDLPAPLLIAFLPFIVGRNAGVIGYYATKGQAMIALKAKIDGCRGLGRILRKRRKIIRKVGYKEIMKYIEPWGNIPAGYHVDF